MSRKNQNKKRKVFDTKKSPDKLILYFSILMTIFGAIMIFDASVYKANESFSDPFHFLKLQLVWIIIGLIIGFLLYIYDYRKLQKLSLLGMIISIVSLILVLLLGEDINGSKRWFSFGPLPPLQPAEFAKIAVILYLSSWMSTNKYFSDKTKVVLKDSFLKSLISFGAIVGVVALLIILEPDLGTTMIIGITSFIMYFIAKEGPEHAKLATISLLLVFLPIVIIAAILEPYRIGRISTYLHLLTTGEIADPRGDGYQMQQILIGIGSGGFLGKGFGQSRQRFGYLVENTAFTDSIFAVILEELGFLGGTILVLAWVIFLWRGFKIGLNAADKQGKLLAIGITVWLTLQALLNIGANVGLIPLTGIPAPFLSYGGSSTIVTLAGIGILLNISKHSKT
ncbi:MAG TPA: putative peptidoglycan glycosyltransferase FtsW [Candidatus Dojkabacteria bacterium]|jgi:cell division protein FtsW|nr:putative peptidoglycan glycosyltransferase FtsW [Candidatus Dojkabacteria bacterium]